MNARYRSRRILTVVLAASASAACIAAGSGGNRQVEFISCPVYRDTDAGLKSGCWLATDYGSGVRYDISRGRTKPQLGKKVLVEGKVAETPDTCGGVVLEPMRVSVLQEPCKEFMLPAEGYPGIPFTLPKRVLQPLDVPRTVPEPPYRDRTFTIYFDFNSNFPIYQYSELILEDASIYIKASGPKQVVVTGYAATDAYAVSGRKISEKPEVAKSRAEIVSEALRRLGVPEKILQTSWKGHAEPTADGDAGLSNPSRRRVTISVRP